jgi:crossover junction endodeoxyribonuclease RusA
VIVILPWPRPELSPNARVNWRTKCSAAKRYKLSAYLLAKAARPVPGLTVSITFNPPDNVRRDLDNMLASIKSGLDGIAYAIGVDDSKWALTIAKGAPVKGGQVVVKVTA